MSSISERVKAFRASSDYKKWRQSVLKRDGNRCTMCSAKDMLEVDHIKPLSLYPELALDEDNGRVLCKPCHIKTSTYGSGSRFTGGDGSIHPILSGDLLYRIQSLPSAITLGGKDVGFQMRYDTNCSKWICGYEVSNVKMMFSGNTIEESINGLFDALRKSSQKSSYDETYLFNEKTMEEKTSRILRQELYAEIENMLGRRLETREKSKLSRVYKKSVKKYFDDVILNK